ncbi:hypothetical protein ACS5PM_13045 [Ideonella sp. YS5]
MPEFMTPPPSLLPAPPSRRSSVETDMHSLEDQLRRCSRGEPSRLHLASTMDALLRLLRRHLVSLVVVLALLSAAVALGF